VLGVVGKKLIHLMTSQERDKVPKVHEMWIDIGCRTRKEALTVVDIGDPITYDPNFEVLRRDLVVSKGFDDKMGVFVVAEAMRLVSEERRRLKASLFSVATVQEEVGLRGARTSTYGIDPTVGIAVDVTWATDHPDMDPRQAGQTQVGKGPILCRGANVNPVVFDLLVQTAKREKIPVQVEATAGGTGTDGNAIQLSRAGVATGIVCVPLRYMHTPVELLSLRDLEQAARLIAAFSLRVDEKTSFIP
jgi:endoglucanase